MNDLNGINYQPLQVMNNAWRAAFRRTFKLWGVALGVTFLAAILASSLFIAIDLLAAVLVLYVLALSSRVRNYKEAAWQEFAIANGWPLDSFTPLNVIVPPSLQFGYGQTFSQVIQAQINDLTCDIFTYSCMTGEGKRQQTHNFTIAALAMPQALPHLLLLSKKSKVDLQRDLQAGENLQLEGDFGDYFKLQIEKGQEVDALTIISPDIMQKLVDYSQAEDIEILGNNLYFITDKDERDYRDMQVLIRSVVELGQKITQNISHAAT